MYYVYSAVFTKTEDGYTVEIPDVPGCVTDGETLEEATRMIKDAFGGCLCSLEDHGEHPVPSRVPSDFSLASNQFAAMVDIDTDRYRAETDNHAVRKNVSIPAWLNSRAERAGVNFSQTLQDALKSQLHVQ
jgi:predicted RNase H-like HicB family nuclease